MEVEVSTDVEAGVGAETEFRFLKMEICEFSVLTTVDDWQCFQDASSSTSSSSSSAAANAKRNKRKNQQKQQHRVDKSSNGNGNSGNSLSKSLPDVSFLERLLERFEGGGGGRTEERRRGGGDRDGRRGG